MNEKWRVVWRAIAAHLPTEGLVALRTALVEDDPHLIQGQTMFPPNLPSELFGRYDVCRACAVGYPLWKAGATKTDMLDSAFADACLKACDSLGEQDAARYFLCFWDETPREQARREFLPEVELAIEAKQLQAA